MTTTQPFVSPEERYATLVQALEDSPGVTCGSAGKKGFGSAALQVDGRIFAMLAAGALVLKLPRQRVETLVAAEQGVHFEPRRDGRPMKEWLVLAPAFGEVWLPLAREALEFVAGRRDTRGSRAAQA